MKKIIPSILITVIALANFLAPISVGWDQQKILTLKNKKAEAMFFINGEDTSGIQIGISAKVTDTSITITTEANWAQEGWLSHEYVAVIMDDGTDIGDIKMVPLSPSGKINQVGSVVFSNLTQNTDYYFNIRASQSNVNILQRAFNLATWIPRLFTADDIPVIGEIWARNENTGELKNNTPYKITTLKTGDAVNGGKDVVLENNVIQNEAMFMPVCDTDNLGGCIGIIFYRLFFEPSSYLFALSGKVFDYTFDYTVKSSSYNSVFVTQGWAIVRDFCNLFFIFVLLYIAFGTILKLNSVKTKEMIINVVIIGLLINFSLFATQVIIDTSNILARVFYNSIIVGDKIDNVIVEKNGAFGEKQISEALVRKINPQQIIISAGEAEKIGLRTNVANEEKGAVNSKTFILVTLLASAMNIVGFIVFLTVAGVFIVRVVGLWLAIILAPLAFFSYTVPALQGLDMIGWKKWWPETLKLAFLAPVFIFFIYLIVKFLESGLGVLDASNKHGLDFYVAVLVPFAFLMILLTKAKKIAVKMAGDMGEMVSKAGSAVGGLALGAATGGTAMMMRGTLGRIGSSIASSDKLKMAEAKGVFGAKMLRNIGKSAGKGSFDIRGTKLGASAGKGLGVDLGKPKEGGYEKARADNVEKRIKRAKELEVGEDSAETQVIRQAEHALHEVKTDPVRQNTLVRLNNGEPDQTIADDAEQTLKNNPMDPAAVIAFVESRGLGGLERYVAGTERNVAAEERALKDATNALLAIDPADLVAKAAAQAAVDIAKQNRNAEINGGARATDRVNSDGTRTSYVAIGRDQAKNNLEKRQAAIRAQEGPIHAAENALKIAENNKIGKNNQIRAEYAETIQGEWSNAINSVISLGEHSAQGEREAANKILSGAQETKKITESH